MDEVVVIAFYKFVAVEEPPVLQKFFRAELPKIGVKGTILIATEGINGMLGGSRSEIDAAISLLQSDGRFSDLEHKESYCQVMPFEKLKIRLKREIVALGVEGVSPLKKVGTYVAPKDWNALISDPETIVIDTRNDFECELGLFKGAIDPKTEVFRDFPAFVKKNLSDAKEKTVAMYCTGGIRCEKATSYLLDQGFKKVYHLQGGILKYLEEIPKEENLFEGECFVFDERVSLNQQLKPTNE